MTVLGRFFLCLPVLALFFSAEAHAATITASSCSQADVQAAINTASNGDTVAVPGCACGAATWSSAVKISKSVTIQGQGAANTCIEGYGFTTAAGIHNWRITGFHFVKTSTTNAITVSSGTLYGGTPVTGWVIDNNTIDGYGNGAINIYNGSTGLIANNLFTNTVGSDSVIYINGRDSLDWATPSFFGTAKQYVFVEDNKFVTSSSSSNHVVMSQWGGSYVFRCNETTSTGSGTYKDIIDAHGFGSGTWRRAPRQWEVYGNHFENNNYSYRSINLRGGTGRVFANNWSNPTTFISVTDYRTFYTPGVQVGFDYPINNDCSQIGQACSISGEATCCSDHEGYPCCDQIGRGQDKMNGQRQGAEPAYFWDNKSDTGKAIPVNVDPNSGDTILMIKQDRDFYTDVIPAGYAPYVYPHPSRGLTATNVCLTDGNSQAKTGIAFWPGTPTPAPTRPSPPGSLRVN